MQNHFAAVKRAAPWGGTEEAQDLKKRRKEKKREVQDLEMAAQLKAARQREDQLRKAVSCGSENPLRSYN